jgi:hypothetical protein
MEIKLETAQTNGIPTQSDPRRRELAALIARVRSEDEPGSMRQRLLCYCRRYRISERAGWREIAAFDVKGLERLVGAAHMRRPQLFDGVDRRLREAIVRLTVQLSRDTFDDFAALLNLLERFIERIRFLSDLVVHVFLERERGNSGSEPDAESYLCWYTNKLFREVDVIAQAAKEEEFLDAISARYWDWASEKLLDEEAII